jgi:hypothetical protein
MPHRVRHYELPSAAQWKAIEQWFWRTGVTGYFSGWNSGMMAADLAEIGRFTRGEKSELSFPTQRPDGAIWMSRQFRLNTAHSKILAIVMAYSNPLDILTGVAIDTSTALSWQNSKEFHHFFPQAFLKSIGVSSSDSSALANVIFLTSASNKLISDRSPKAYLDPLLQANGDRALVWLESNLVSQEAIDAALQNDYPAFIDARSKTIHAKVMQFAGWDL